MSSETIPSGDVQVEGSVESSQLPTGQKKKREGPYRGPSRAIKYKKMRRSQPPRIKVTIPEQWGAVVGERANQFVAECGEWVKEMCPLNVKKWEDMPKDVLDRLYGKIMSKYELPEGAHVKSAMKNQCSNLYRHWRERLKKKYFTNSTSLRDVERSCPSDIDPAQWRWLVYDYWSSAKQRERSEKNRANALSMKIRSTTGSKSIPRVLHELDNEIERSVVTEGSTSDSTSLTQIAEPKYIQLWIKTKGHKDGRLDEEAEIVLEKLRDLHLKMIEERGSDELSVEEAYEMVLGHSSSHARGLGRAHPVPSKKEGFRTSEIERREQELRADFERREIELRAEIEKKENEAREREQELRAEIEKKENEAREREQDLRVEIERKEKEAMEREAKLREDIQAQMLQMFSQMSGSSAGR